MKHDPKLKGKRSAPNLRTKKSAVNLAPSSKPRRGIKANYVQGVRTRASAPNLRQAAEELPPKAPLPSSPAPESQSNESNENDKQDGDSQPKEAPRFMSYTQAKVKPVEYKPPRVYTGPPIPKIMGIEPIFFRPKPVVVKKETRKERILNEIRKRYQIRKARVRGVVKNIRNIRALRTVHALKSSVKAMRKDAQERLLECKPIYHIKEIKELRRASMFLGLPRLQKRPLSTLSIGSTFTLGNIRRYSEISVYSRASDSPKLAELFPEAGTSTEVEDGPGPTIVNEDDGYSVRQSLLFFSDVASLIQTHPNFRNSGEGITHPESLASSSSFLQHQNSRSLSLSSSILHYHSFPNNLEGISPRSSFSDNSSDITITPLRIQKKARMPPEPGSASKDPFVDSSTAGNQTADNPDNAESPVTQDVVENTTDHAVSTATPDQDNTISSESARPEALNKGKAVNRNTPEHGSHGSRIPAPSSQKLGAGGSQQKSTRVTSDHRSSIPVAVRKASTEHQNMPQGGSSRYDPSEIVVMEPTTARPSPFQRQINTLWGYIPDEVIDNEVSRYSSDSSSSGDLEGEPDDEDELERPTGYTGDNRRPFERSAQCFYGPRLQIASSAENVIMGTPKLASKSSPDLKRDVPRTATQGSPHNARLGEQSSRLVEGGLGAKASPAGTPEASRNFCRPRPSLENISRRDFSGRELSIPRKPVSNPSFTDLTNLGSYELESQYMVPKVPKIPDEHNASLNKDKPLPSLKAVAVKGAAGSDRLHPTRTSSLQSVPASQGGSIVTTPRTPHIPHQSGATDLEGPVTFDDIVPDSKQSAQRSKGGKFPDSKSNRMLDSFRNMFKHKSTADKARLKNQESPDAAIEGSGDQAQSGADDRANQDDGKLESAKTASRSRIRSPRLPEPAAWSKGGPRSISAPIHVSPGAFPTPTSSLSSMPAPSPRGFEEHGTPSFARPTKSTRTRAATNPRFQTPVAAEGRSRRTSSMAASTGSPQRSTRVSRHLRSATGSRKAARAKRIADEQAPVSESPRAVPSQTTNASDTDWWNLSSERKDEKISEFMDRIYLVICEETDGDKRAEMLRETLALKHQLDTVNNTRGGIKEVEEMLRKKVEKKAAEEQALYEKFLQAQATVTS